MSTPLPKPQVPGSRSQGSNASFAVKSTKSSSTKTHARTTATHREVPHYSKPKKSRSAWNSVLWVLIIVILGVLLRANKDIILSKLEERWLRGDATIQTDMSNTLFVGQDANLTGSISENMDKISYTHTLQTLSYGVVWLRSNTIPLQQYINTDVQIIGKVVDYKGSTYIVDVVDIISLSVNTNTGTLLTGKELLSSAGIILSDIASDNLTWDKSSSSLGISQWLFSINDMTTNAKVMIRYITCDSSNVARDCAWFAKSFGEAQREDFVDSYGNTFYKLADAKTRFASIDNQRGIYLESDDATMIARVMRHIQFISNTRARKTFLTTAKDICVSPSLTINMPTMFTIVPYEDTFTVRVDWTATNGGSVVCTILIDPSNSLGGKLMNIATPDAAAWAEIPEMPDTTTQWEIENQDPVVINNNGGGMTAPSIKQFPLKPGKELTFNSRGKKIMFPSSNIAFSSFNVNEKIGWLICSMGTKAIVYANKAELETNPSIILYSCKTGKPTLSDSMVSFDAAGMTYIVDIKDPAWYDFATHIIIENTSTESQ